MNRIEQILGRGVRTKSHCQLPFKDRNVEIYLHATLLDNDQEAVDLYLYRLSELKAMQTEAKEAVARSFSKENASLTASSRLRSEAHERGPE